MDSKVKDTESSKSKIKNKRFMIGIVAVILLLLVSGGIIVFSLVTDTTFGEMLEYFAPEKTEETMVLDEFLVNVTSAYGSTDQVLRINIAIKYMGADNKEVLMASTPIIRDKILTNIRALRMEYIHQEDTIIGFKENTRKALDEIFESIEITEVFVTDMIVR